MPVTGPSLALAQPPCALDIAAALLGAPVARRAASHGVARGGVSIVFGCCGGLLQWCRMSGFAQNAKMRRVQEAYACSLPAFGIASPFLGFSRPERCVGRDIAFASFRIHGNLRAAAPRAHKAHLACVFILLEPAQRASATITCLQAMFVGCAAARLLRPGTKESASRRCEGGLTGRCGRSAEFLTRLLCVTHPHCVVVPVLRNALQTTAWLPYHSTYWIIPV